MRKELTFELLPQAIEEISNKLEQLEKLIKEKEEEKKYPDSPISIKQTSEFLNLSIPTLYSKVSKREIPHMKRGGRLYFLRSELTEYLKSGKQKTVSEIEKESLSAINKKGGCNG